MGKSTEPRALSLAEAFARSEVLRGPGCSVAVMLRELSDVDRVTVEGWLNASLDEVSHARITRALKLAGHHFGPDTIGRHRRRECGCAR